MPDVAVQISFLDSLQFWTSTPLSSSTFSSHLFAYESSGALPVWLFREMPPPKKRFSERIPILRRISRKGKEKQLSAAGGDLLETAISRASPTIDEKESLAAPADIRAAANQGAETSRAENPTPSIL